MLVANVPKDLSPLPAGALGALQELMPMLARSSDAARREAIVRREVFLRWVIAIKLTLLVVGQKQRRYSRHSLE
jgi:hypothetical protein